MLVDQKECLREPTEKLSVLGGRIPQGRRLSKSATANQAYWNIPFQRWMKYSDPRVENIAKKYYNQILLSDSNSKI